MTKLVRKLELLFNIGIITNLIVVTLTGLGIINSPTLQSAILIITGILAVVYVIMYFVKGHNKDNKGIVTINPLSKRNKIIAILAIFMLFITLILNGVSRNNTVDKNLAISICAITYLLVIYVNIVRYKSYEV